MKKKILIVDDDRLIRGIVVELLNDEFDLTEAVDGTDAVQKYLTFQPDLVLMDILMPNLLGLEAVKQILDIDETAKIIVITGLEDEDLREVILASGVLAYHIKPFDSKRLLLDIGAAIGIREPLDSISHEAAEKERKFFESYNL